MPLLLPSVVVVVSMPLVAREVVGWAGTTSEEVFHVTPVRNVEDVELVGVFSTRPVMMESLLGMCYARHP